MKNSYKKSIGWSVSAKNGRPHFFFQKWSYCLSIIGRAKLFTRDWHTEIRLPLTMKKLKEKQPKTARIYIHLHYDNPSPHSSSKAKGPLNVNEVQLIGHLPYKPDLTTCDFYLVSKFKYIIRSAKFTRVNLCWSSISPPSKKSVWMSIIWF